MADFSLGTYGTGRLECWVNWNDSNNASFHYRLQAEVRGGFWDTSGGANWNGNVSGYGNASGSWTYSSNGWRTLREFDVTIGKDANGYLTVNAYGYINGNNGGSIGAGSTNFNVGTTRIGVAPPWAASVADSIASHTARIGNEIGGFGKGTSAAMRMYYKPVPQGWWHQTEDQGDVGGYNYFNIASLGSNTTYQYFGRQWNNNGDTGDGGVQTFKTLPYATAGAATNVVATTATLAGNVGGSLSGEANPTSKIQHRKVGAATWIDTATSTSLAPSFNVTGLLPNTQYEYRTSSTNSTGTHTSTTSTFTTLPAGKLIYSNGEVKNAIPRRVNADNSVTMMNINIVDPS